LFTILPPPGTKGGPGFCPVFPYLGISPHLLPSPFFLSCHRMLSFFFFPYYTSLRFPLALLLAHLWEPSLFFDHPPGRSLFPPIVTDGYDAFVILRGLLSSPLFWLLTRPFSPPQKTESTYFRSLPSCRESPTFFFFFPFVQVEGGVLPSRVTPILFFFPVFWFPFFPFGGVRDITYK